MQNFQSMNMSNTYNHKMHKVLMELGVLDKDKGEQVLARNRSFYNKDYSLFHFEHYCSSVS